MTKPINQDEINSILWKACDTFRGTIDPAYYKDYILVMLFVKYISDVWLDKLDELRDQYGDDEDRIQRRLKRERFVLPDGADFYTLWGLRNQSNIGEYINMALDKIEEANPDKLENVFRNIDFNSEANLGQTAQRNECLKNLLNDFNSDTLNLRPSRLGNLDVIGNAYEYLIGRFAAGAGKKAGEFYTPPEVSTLLARLLDPQPGERICDPACGSGSLLIKCVDAVGSEDYAVYAQEVNGSTWALCMMNMFLHSINVTQRNIRWGDTLKDPQLIEDGGLMRYNVVVANPPFSLDKWGADNAGNDQYERFWRGVPPKSKGDYAFITHMIETTFSEPSHNGRAGVIVPHGVLFRGSSDGRIRKQLIDENLLDAVIGLPTNLFYGTGIPAAILIFKRNKTNDKVLFIDASNLYQEGSSINRLRDQDVNRIIDVYQERESVEGFAYLASREEIVENNYNLNISRYIFAFDDPSEQILVSTGKDLHDVFVSYSHVDRHMKEKIVEEIISSGLSVWEDDAYTLDIGTPDWQIAIEKAIENSNALVVLLSPDSKKSIWVRRELMYAEAQGKPIFPVLIKGDEKSSVPLFLINSQHSNLREDFDKQLSDLIDTLKSRVGVIRVKSPFIYDLDKIRPNWTYAKLTDFTDIKRSTSFKSRKAISESGKYPIYGRSGIVGYSDEYDYDGDYILVTTNLTANHKEFTKNAWQPEESRFSIDMGVYALRPKDSIMLNFLLYSLWITDFRIYTVGSMENVQLKDVKICVPPLIEQQEIVEYIDEHMSVIKNRESQLNTRLRVLSSRKIGSIHRVLAPQERMDNDHDK